MSKIINVLSFIFVVYLIVEISIAWDSLDRSDFALTVEEYTIKSKLYFYGILNNVAYSLFETFSDDKKIIEEKRLKRDNNALLIWLMDKCYRIHVETQKLLIPMLRDIRNSLNADRNKKTN